MGVNVSEGRGTLCDAVTPVSPVTQTDLEHPSNHLIPQWSGAFWSAYPAMQHLRLTSVNPPDLHPVDHFQYAYRRIRGTRFGPPILFSLI